MLYELKLKNYRSFLDEMTFDMYSCNPDDSADSRSYAYGDRKILKLAALFGANGSGKSALLSALGAIKYFAIQKSIDNTAGRQWYLKNHFCLIENNEEPVVFNISFLAGGRLYEYHLAIGLSGIESESLFRLNKDESEKICIFLRKGFTIEGSSIKNGVVKRLIQRTLQSESFLSVLSIVTQMGLSEEISIIDCYNWFMRNLQVVDVNTPLPEIADMLDDNEDMRAFVSEVLSLMDLGIDELTVVKYKESKGLQLSCHGMKTDASGVTGGTALLLRMLPYYYKAIKLGCTVVFDGIDRSLHPCLIAMLVSMFGEKPTNGQMILATHKTYLMASRALFPDEIWFAEKKEQVSELYPLRGFEDCRDLCGEVIEQRYLNGAFGAVPPASRMP